MLNHKAVRILQFAAVVIVSLVLVGSAVANQFVSDTFPAPGSKYVSVNSATHDMGMFDAEIVSMSLSCKEPGDTVPLMDLGGGLYHIDSFFDVFTELSVDGGPATGTFATEIVSMELSGDLSTAGLFDTEIVSMSLSGNAGDIPIQIRQSQTMTSTGQTMITDLGGGLYHIDSFFDVFTELSVDGQTWVPGSRPIRMVMVQEPPEGQHVYKSDTFPVPDGRYKSTTSPKYDAGTFDAEIVSMSLSGSVPQETVSLLNLGGGGQYYIDSFFDVFTELSVDGGAATGMFDTEIVQMELSGLSTAGLFDAEIVSMSLSGDVGGMPVLIREDPSMASTGQTSISDLGGGLYHIDSFFDVFTELSVDGGGTWTPADGPVRMELVPDPPPEPTLVAGVNIDIHMDISGVVANDFHVEGRIESGDPGGGWSQPPVLIDHIDGWFPNFNITIVPDLTDTGQNWFIINADWSGAEYKYCDILHLGLFFDVTCHNIIIDLIGYWTKDGQRIVDAPAAPPLNGGAVPIPGFEVKDMPADDVASPGQTFELRNDSHLADHGGIPLEIVQMDLAVVESEEKLERLLGPEPHRELNVNGRQSKLPWVSVISPLQLPVPLPPGGSFLVQLEDFDMTIPPGGFLIGRQLIQFENNNSEPDFRWVWEIHQAHQAELGDAPDSTNTHGAAMTTYGGVGARFPTVFGAGSPPHGPKHHLPRAVAFLGPMVSPEMEADIWMDWDGVNNIWPPLNAADQDGFDDGVVLPLLLPHCGKCAFPYTVNVMNPNVNLYVNVWFDFNRDGDWDDTLPCGDLSASEWAVKDQLLPAGSLVPGLNNVFTPGFLAWHPAAGAAQETWMRITIAEQPYPFGTGAPGAGYGGAGPATGYKFGETEDYYFIPITEIAQSDLGDASDSTNSHGVAMTAYPKGGPPGVLANYPVVFQAGSPPCGPKHLQPRAVAHLGENVSLEVEADTGLDEDGVNNIDPPTDSPDQDRYDDGLLGLPLHLPHCDDTNFKYLVNVITPDVDLYFNAWLDWTRDGDWDDTLKCPDGTLAPEWAVQNQLLAGLSNGLHTIDSPYFRPWHPAATAGQKIWMRMTLSEQPWYSSGGAGMVGTGGSGPTSGYEYGETEDYYFRPKYPLISDLNWDGVVNFYDVAIQANEWGHTGPR